MTCKQLQLTVSCLKKKHNQEYLDLDISRLTVDQELLYPAQEIWPINMISIVKLLPVIVCKELLPLKCNLYKNSKMKQFLNSTSQIHLIINEILDI